MTHPAGPKSSGTSALGITNDGGAAIMTCRSMRSERSCIQTDNPSRGNSSRTCDDSARKNSSAVAQSDFVSRRCRSAAQAASRSSTLQGGSLGGMGCKDVASAGYLQTELRQCQDDRQLTT